MSYEVKSHRLHLNGAAVSFVPTPNGGGVYTPLYLILHYTAGTRAEGAISWFKESKAQASAHLVVDIDGTVTQMRDFNRTCWHAGKSSWAGLDALNGHSIGIEIANAGKLSKRADGKWVTWVGTVIPDKDVIVATHKDETSAAGWHVYTAAQIEAAIEVGIALNERYSFLDVLGHDDISRHRKVDPGPAFPMISVRSKILGRIES